MSLPSQSANGSGPAKGWWSWSGPSLGVAADLLFPPRCACCGRECLSRPGEPLLCESCSAELAPATRPACLRCAKHCQESDVLAGSCFECRGRKLLIDGARTLGPYEGPLRDAVLRIKHYQHEPLARALGVRLAENLRRQPFDPPPEVIAPVP